MKNDYSFLGIGAAVVLLVIIFGGVLYLGTFNLSSPASYSVASEASGMQKDSYRSEGYRTTYHVFNYFNSGAPSAMLLLGIIITLAIINRLYTSTDSILAFLLYIIGTLLIFASATIFLFGVHDLLTFNGVGETRVEPTAMQQYGWLIETVVFGLLGSGFVWAGEYIRRREEEEGSLFYLAMAPVASLLVLFTIPVFVFGIHGSIGLWNAESSFEWIIESIVFGGLAVLAFSKIDKARFANGEKSSWKPYSLYAVGYSLLAPAFFMFIFGVIALLNAEVDSEDMGKLFLEVLVFAAFGFASFYLIDFIRKKDKDFRSCFPLALSPGGFLFILAATAVFLVGFNTWIRADITASNYKSSFSWIIETLVFGLLGAACLMLSDRIRNKVERSLNHFPQALSLSSLVVWLSSIGLYILVIESYFGEHPDGKLLAQFIVYAAVGLGLVVYSDRLKKEEGFPGTRVLPTFLSFSGGFMILVTLFMFVIGLHDFLYSSDPNLKWLMKDIAYGIAGAACLVAGNHLSPILPEKKPRKKREKEKPIIEKEE